MRLEGKKAVITGSASGFGKETALLFAREGAEISLLDINAESAQKVATEIAKIGGRAHVMQVDVSEEESVKSAFSQALEQMHTVDILINCAGYGRSSRIQDLTLEQWRRLIDVNMTGTFLCCREIIPHMVERQCGKIVNLASICAQTGRMVAVDYAGSKSGIVGITRALALQVAADGINVNAIAPGPVVTPLFEKNYTTEQMNSLLSTIPFKRKGTPTDIANLLLFLSSDESGWITGEVIAINGGAFIG
ncbi:SDR family oxidoreductase [Anaerotruncus sp. 1XD22-93]|nr:SDR family oxidoreductase [Anaerotruncus sp.]NBK17987.1 SDR family oxidoreductase [Anaerotruncus sp. 1XD42-93]RKJ93684.1 SDR family oxidoreductase [Anaerotruncus sp. 1XD22-93]